MKTVSGKHRYRILWCEAFGFLLLLALAWGDELPNWRRVIWETIAIVAVWVGVNFATSRILLRLQRLEDFLRVCAWCKKVEHDEQWVPFEQFLDRGLNTRATHGMCPHCASQFAAGVRAMAVKRN